MEGIGMSYTNILFDLDGTLTDPKLGITKSVQYALKKLNIEISDLNALEPFIGPPLGVSFKEIYHFNEEKVIVAIEYYREYFSINGLFENEVYEGIRELLETLLSHSDIRLFVATSKPTTFANRILEHFNLLENFEYVCGSELDGTRSDKTEIITYIIDKFNLDKEQTIMIGDRKHDIIGANNNKIHSIGVGFGYGDEEELLNISPTYIVNTVTELADLLMSSLSVSIE